MIRQVIFDWSGTLCDDRNLTLAASNQTLQHFGGSPVDEATYRRDFVLPIEHFYQPLIGDISRAEIDQQFFQRYRQLALQSRLFPLAELLIRLLNWRGLRLGIVSTMATDILETLLQQRRLRDQFAFVRGDAADKIPVLQAIAADNTSPDNGSTPPISADETLYIGDMIHDVTAAKAAGMIAGAALYGYSQSDQLLAAGADHHYADIDAIIHQLDREQLLATEHKVIATVGGIVVSEQGNILLVRTRKWANKFGLPGGKIDYGETMEAAFRREIAEETGLQLTEVDWLTAQDAINHPQFREPRHFILINYIARVAAEPAPIANYESQQIGWYSLDEALAMDLNGPTRTALELVLAHPWLQAGSTPAQSN